ncbi:MAG: hypothetical protein H7A37_02630 [Chlamydiales bacterium]|nr:hypothetical protein [Chlamydiia bacterium]MCP5507184.1 hypothetical protein [Chlamydiales bacterium]
MRHVKSERLKKLEQELTDLEQWLKLGLVPKKDIEKHKEEIIELRSKIEEEKERLQFLKESGDMDEYIAPKRQQARTAFTELPTIPDIDIGDNSVHETQFDIESESTESEGSSTSSDNDDESEADEATVTDEDEESYFSDKNRWRRGGIVDPDADDW